MPPPPQEDVMMHLQPRSRPTPYLMASSRFLLAESMWASRSFKSISSFFRAATAIERCFLSSSNSASISRTWGGADSSGGRTDPKILPQLKAQVGLVQSQGVHRASRAQ